MNQRNRFTDAGQSSNTLNSATGMVSIFAWESIAIIASMNRVETKNNSIFEINCNFPALIACEGLIMLSDFITPHKVMMYGNAIPQKHIMGNGSEMRYEHETMDSFWDSLLDSSGMNYYVDEFRTAKDELLLDKLPEISSF